LIAEKYPLTLLAPDHPDSIQAITPHNVLYVTVW